MSETDTLAPPGAHQGLSIPNLSYVTFESVVEVVLVSFAGFICAYTGLLPKSGQKNISLLNVDLFTPCLIFSKLAKSLSVAKILEISIIPLFYALTTSISYFSGFFISKFFHFDVDETNFVIANSIFGNSNSLPVSLTLSLAYTLPGLTWDEIPDDNRDNVASRGILYLLIFQQIGQVLRWSWGYNKLMRWSDQRTASLLESSQNLISEEDSHAGVSSTNDFDNQGDYYNQGLDNVCSPKNDDIYIEHSTSSSVFSKFKSKIVGAINKVRSFMNPPLYAMLFSVIVASVHPVQHEFFHANGFINNTLSSAITELGSVSIPLILIVLGSNLYPADDESAKRSPNYKKLVFASIIGRMILPSLVLLPIIACCVKFIGISILDDPIFLVVGFILTVSPPAIQLTQITQLNEFFEAEMAGILFWGYVVLVLPVSIFVVIFAMSVLKWAGV
ncbi:AEC family transporter SCDLUD_003588 [Saccharomycodes ludwigii]|uniref:AEC family transporter n=1 Tax=Saccharomycodes ludwigii TaxID=36035 RepID=UPI001E8A4139|nr:hypothetical protein SCDLUD_003588 [Saccharomycodes ludwigii]KAH3900596.1 hypothetical protein SCDLUD_003588 [Saccharomycodes ludwigii]